MDAKEYIDNIDRYNKEMPTSTVGVDEYNFSDKQIAWMLDNYQKQVKDNVVLDGVSGISTDYEKDLFRITNEYVKAGLDKPHTVSRLEWVLGSVKKS